MKENLPNYDFLASVYKGTDSIELKETLDSINDQTLAPKNIFIVIDGKISDKVYSILTQYQNKLPINLINSKKNQGLGLALRKGLQKCESEIVLRFDTDDINSKNRAYMQVKELINSKADIVGSQIYEFINHQNKYVSKKRMPIEHSEIEREILFRNPINHPTVAFIKDSIIGLNGGYRHFPLYEDYDLWLRALKNGLKFKNIDLPLVAMRIKNQRARRRGLKIIIKESRLISTFFEVSMLKGILFVPIFFARSIITLLPEKLFNLFYEFFLREKVKF